MKINSSRTYVLMMAEVVNFCEIYSYQQLLFTKQQTECKTPRELWCLDITILTKRDEKMVTICWCVWITRLRSRLGGYPPPRLPAMPFHSHSSWHMYPIGMTSR